MYRVLSYTVFLGGFSPSSYDHRFSLLYTLIAALFVITKEAYYLLKLSCPLPSKIVFWGTSIKKVFPAGVGPDTSSRISTN